MDFKNKNLLNIFNPAAVNNDSLIMTALAILPAAFVAKTIEAALVYLLLALIFFIISTLVSKLVQLVFKGENSFIVNSVSFVFVSMLTALVSRTFFIQFDNEFNIYIILLATGSLPYMLRADNENVSLDKSMLNTLKSFVGFSIIIIIIAVLREVLGTGMITFGNYTSIVFNQNLFKNYALTLMANPLAVFIILGFIIAFMKRKEEKL